jgi:hypothetical protein
LYYDNLFSILLVGAANQAFPDVVDVYLQTGPLADEPKVTVLVASAE